jgi:glucose-6-phosphate 1-dehydrogenase
VQSYAVRGQYSDGWIQGKQVKGYRGEEKVDPHSAIETFAAVKFIYDNWRWQDVPFYVRTGKSMHQKTSIITIQFKRAPHYAFPPEAADTWAPQSFNHTASNRRWIFVCVSRQSAPGKR